MSGSMIGAVRTLRDASVPEDGTSSGAPASLVSKTVKVAKPTFSEAAVKGVGRVGGSHSAVTNTLKAAQVDLRKGVRGAGVNGAITRASITTGSVSGGYKAYKQYQEASKSNDSWGKVRAGADGGTHLIVGTGGVLSIPSDIANIAQIDPGVGVVNAQYASLGFLGTGLLIRAAIASKRALHISAFMKELDTTLAGAKRGKGSKSTALGSLLTEKGKFELERVLGKGTIDSLEKEGLITVDGDTIKVARGRRKDLEKTLIEKSKATRLQHRITAVASGIFGIGIFSVFVAVVLNPFSGLAVFGSIAVAIGSSMGLAAQLTALIKAGKHKEAALLVVITLLTLMLMASGLQYIANALQLSYFVAVTLHEYEVLNGVSFSSSVSKIVEQKKELQKAHAELENDDDKEGLRAMYSLILSHLEGEKSEENHFSISPIAQEKTKLLYSKLRKAHESLNKEEQEILIATLRATVTKLGNKASLEDSRVGAKSSRGSASTISDMGDDEFELSEHEEMAAVSENDLA